MHSAGRPFDDINFCQALSFGLSPTLGFLFAFARLSGFQLWPSPRGFWGHGSSNLKFRVMEPKIGKAAKTV